ncbi:MAG TPA: SDR family oxidoreductase [Solirubrobacteraceae bacterium]|jgi:NAD(P)-dependent dehydrogenase (short-subunit alcohol dehydrogenase family)
MPTVLITGASTGIGRATALRLATVGWTVLAGVRKAEDGQRLASEAPSGSVTALTLDVTDTTHIEQARVRVERQAGGLDALVNNAGISFTGPLEIVSLDDVRTIFEVNAFAQVAVTKAMLPALRRKRGRILFVSSIGGRVTMPFTAPYSGSKHALESFGDALRVELRSSGIQVALIEPAAVSTPIWDKSHAEYEQLVVPPELQAYYGRVPELMQRVVKSSARRGAAPEKVAEVIVRALTVRHMKGRYMIGADGRAMLLLKRLLTDRGFDRFARRAMGM